MADTDLTEQPKPHGLERLIFFSDAVIAIAITLLALELPVPEAHNAGELIGALFASEQSWEYLACLLSFGVIGATWLGHHKMFNAMQRSDTGLAVINLIALFGYALVPWASKTLGERHDGSALALYSAVMAILGGTHLLIGWYSVRAGLLDPEVADEFRTGLRGKAMVPCIGFLLAVPLSFVIGAWVVLLWLLSYVAADIYLVLARNRKLVKPARGQESAKVSTSARSKGGVKGKNGGR